MGARPLDRIFVPASIAPAYQPVVDLSGGAVVGAEALARWPELAVTPSEAFAYARMLHRSADLDAACQWAAMHSATISGAGFDLFVNVAPEAGVDLLVTAEPGAPLVADLSARALDTDPSAFLADVARLRAHGVGIALGEVDASDDTMAFIPFLAPDVVRINLGSLLRRSGHQAGRLLDAVATYAGRTGALVLAEGIETDSQATAAVRFGATLGQGWWFGRPGPISGLVGAGAGPLHGIGDHLARQRAAIASSRAASVEPEPVEERRATLTERLIAAMGPGA